MVSGDVAAQTVPTAAGSEVGGEGNRVLDRVNEMDERKEGEGAFHVVVEGREGGDSGARVDVDNIFVEMGQQGTELEGIGEKSGESKGDAEVSDAGEVKIAIEIEADTAEISLVDGKTMDMREIEIESGSEDKYFQDKEVKVSKKRGRGRPRRSPQTGQLQDDNAQVQEHELSQKRKRGRPPKYAVKSSASADLSTYENVQISEQPSSSAKRKRGRPRQSYQADHLGDDNVQVQEQESSQKRQRGRPPKSAVKVSASADCTTDENVQISEHPSSSVKRKRGRPPKLTKLSTLSDDQTPCKNTQTLMQQSSLKRQRGRPRRSSVESAKSNDLTPGANTVVLYRASPVKNDTINSEHADVQVGQSASSLNRKRGRPPLSAAGSSQRTACTQYGSAQEGEGTLPVKKKRGRPRLFVLYSTGDGGLLQDKNKLVGEEELVMRRKMGRPHRIRMVSADPVRYYCQFQDESNGFAVSNLVWGKVKSHPWWPGQIFDATNASEMALNIEKKDHLLVAYFGDRTFAWCNESQLKSFQADFAQMEKENSTYAFLNAIDDALGEVSRQIELGMTCSCIDKDSYTSLMGKNIENSGVREGTVSPSVGKSWIMNSFQPAELVDYVQALAQAPYKGADRLEFVIANAQLKAFNRSKGHPELLLYLLGDQLGNDDQDSPSKNMESDNDAAGPSPLDPSDCTPGREKSRGKGSSLLNKKDVMEDGRKKRSLSELMEENADANSNRPALGSCSYSSIRKAKISNTVFSYRVKTMKKKRLDSLGDVKAKTQDQIIRKHIHMGGHRRQSGTHHDCPQEEQPASKDYTSPTEILSLLSLVAADPLERRKFMNFKSEHPGMDNAEYTQDSYWPDIIVSDDPEERGEDGSQIMRQLNDEPALSLALDLMSLAKEQLQVDSVTTNHAKYLKAERSLSNSDEEVEECMPTELVLRMSDSDNFPAVADLIKFFGRYGPLREGETEVIEETKFAKVVFKRRADAELALSNAGECSIFGQASVSYTLRHLESLPETSPNGMLDSQEVQKVAGAGGDAIHIEAI